MLGQTVRDPPSWATTGTSRCGGLRRVDMNAKRLRGIAAVLGGIAALVIAITGFMALFIRDQGNDPPATTVASPSTTVPIATTTTSPTSVCDHLVSVLNDEVRALRNLHEEVQVNGGRPTGFKPGYNTASRRAADLAGELDTAAREYENADLALPSGVDLAPDDLNQLQTDLNNLTEFLDQGQPASDEYGGLTDWANKLQKASAAISSRCR